MKVKRYFAASMSAALKQVREDMGDDAVILSSKRVDGGVEIVTALDYDENLARQRLGDAAAEATNGGRLAEMQADQHRHLEQELGRSRERIRELRGQNKPQMESSDWSYGNTRAAPEVISGTALPEGDELALMRDEISSLRELVTRRQPSAQPAPADVKVAADATVRRLSERLQEFGLNPELAESLARQNGRGRLEDGWKQALKILAAGVRSQQGEWLQRGGVYALVGPTGSGKTTTIGKIAARYVLEHGAESLALVTTDRYRVAAHEQLFVFGRILNVPVRVVDDTHTLDAVLDELADRHLVLVDTAGLTRSDPGCNEQLQELANSHHRIQTQLVVPATSQPRIMKSMWHCYKMANLAGCVMTKLDEALTLGEVLGFAMETSLPVAWVTDGQKIPQDLHPANPASLVRLGIDRLKELRRQHAVAEGA
ncbi:flagellar biosynthesis protein FlhF [uncultured Marinobacter sp.]|uniref:flagellar biosynthesis protein FlhF n=1 Tax=uncultured Marinobacter sp. TaxID=187379 RepID=UPI0030DCC4BB